MDQTTKQLVTSSAELLSQFVREKNDVESEMILSVLFSSTVTPIVSSILRRKMNASMAADDMSGRNLDALELAADINAQLLEPFRGLRSNPSRDGNRIENPEAYIRAVTNNAFRQFLRDKYPLRFRLKNKIKYIVRNRSGYAIWQADDGRQICGLSEWKHSKESIDPSLMDEQVLAALHSPKAKAVSLDDNRKIIEVLDGLFAHVGKPIRIDDVVSLVAKVLGLADPTEIELDETTMDDRGSLEDQIFERLSLEHFWEEIVRMPLRHRTALLLNLRGENGENIIAFLPMLRIASVRRIAEVLEIEPEELAAIWNRLPLEDKEISERLDITRQQVINLRQRRKGKS